MIELLAVLFGTVAALLGAAAAVGWQRAARAEARVRQAGRTRAALADLVEPRPLGDTLVSRRG